VNLPLLIARKYFFSRRKRNFINIISLISMTGVAVCTAALIIVLSVFNGLEDLMRSLYTSFDPELKVAPREGKSFVYDSEFEARLLAVPGVSHITEVIEDYAYLKYRDSEVIATIRGVSDNFLDKQRLQPFLMAGDMRLHRDGVDFAIIGRGIQYALNAHPLTDYYALQVFYIKDVKVGTLDPSSLYNRRNILLGGVFEIEKKYDESYVFLPLEFVKELVNYGDRRSFLEVHAIEGVNPEKIKKQVEAAAGSGFEVLTNEEQHMDLYRLFKLEKLFAFIALSLILAVGSVNIFFSLSMLVLDKKKDIAVLYAMGATDRLVRRVFLAEGALISLTGAAIGLVLGAGICLAQQEFGLVSMGMETHVLESYPVKLRLMDFVYTGMALLAITVAISYKPAQTATRFNKPEFL
jgi:lipoprotein-releasing system permease protein